jgi:hypothetical protein
MPRTSTVALRQSRLVSPVITLIRLGELGRLIGAVLRRQSYMPSTNHEPVAASR